MSSIGLTERRSTATIRPVLLVRAAVVLTAAVILVVDLWLHASRFLNPGWAPTVGWDLAVIQDAARHWLAGQGFYPAYQLAGPFLNADRQILYPPISLALFLPSLLLPAVLWWVLPLGTIAAVVVHWRPSPWAWLLIGLCLAQEESVLIVSRGNPSMWIAAFVALGTIWRPAFALVFLKPSLAPFALLGVRSRSWWLVTAALAAVSLALLPMDLDWLRSMLNATGDHSGLLYSLRSVPFVAVPVVAWLLRDPVDPDRARRDVAGVHEEPDAGDGGR